MNKKLFIVFLSLCMALGSSSAYAAFISDKWNFENDGTDLVMEGATDDAYETSLSITDPTADRTIVVPNASGTVQLSGAADIAGSVIVGSASTILFEGATADAFETTLTVTDPTADLTITLPTGTGTAYVAVDTTGATSGNVLLETEIDASSELLALMDDETGTGVLTFATAPTFTTSVTVGSAGVVMSDDGDGAITFLGAGNGSDEDLQLNLDDTSNTVVASSSTGVTSITLTAIGLTSTATGALGWTVVNSANQACNTTCTSACVIGMDAGASAFVDCAGATSDSCLCAGAS